MNALEEIRNHIRGRSDLRVLDKPVFLRHDLNVVISAMGCQHVCTAHYFDVPISAFVGLGRDDFFEKGDTWRDLVDRRLHGHNGTWDERIFGYFENDLKEEEFPASGSREPMDLSCVDGAVFCTTGNHRLPAGIAWLAATRPQRPVFQQVRMSVSEVDRRIVDHLNRWRQDDFTISVYQTVQQIHYFRIQRGSNVQTLTFEDGTIRPATAADDGRWGFRSRPIGEDWEWTPIPDMLLDAWNDRGWLLNQLGRAQRATRP